MSTFSFNTHSWLFHRSQRATKSVSVTDACGHINDAMNYVLTCLSLVSLNKVTWLVTSFPPWWSRFDPRSGHTGFLVGGARADFLSTLVYPADFHSTNCSTFINHPIIDTIQSQHWQCSSRYCVMWSLTCDSAVMVEVHSCPCCQRHIFQ
jgi:hypothetical protein